MVPVIADQYVYAILASYNRRELTVRVIEQLLSQPRPSGINIHVVLFDDGSTDGTAAAVRSRFPDVEILHGSGDAFWAKSMASAESHVLQSSDLGNDDFLLWINDDVELERDALFRALSASARTPGAVIVGAMREPGSQVVSYSGMRRSGRHPLRYTKVVPTSADQAVDSMNGNFALVPAISALAVGGIDGNFSHAWADIDYGYRCIDAGVPVILAPGFFGECATNPVGKVSALGAEWKRFIGQKGGGNPSSLKRILKRHAGRKWIIYFAATYLLWWPRAVRARFARKSPGHRTPHER